jgi:mono/diheme cytochrome c family protein
MKALVPIFCAVAGLSFASPASTQQQAAADAKVIYEKNCRSCHGPRGIPPQAMARMMKVPPLDSAYFTKKNDDTVVVVLKKGRGTNMKPFGDKLSEQQMQAVARYIRELATGR